MFRRILAVAAATALTAAAQERRGPPRVDVESYVIEAEVLPAAQSLKANVTVRFSPLEENTTSASFELNNALNLSRVVDESGRQIAATRSRDDFSVRLSFPDPLPKGKPVQLTFTYDGRLQGNEESPVTGIRFASIQPEFAYLLYPARWFPVNEYTADRFVAELKINVPPGYRVVSGGLETKESAAEGHTIHQFRVMSPAFPGSIALVKDDAVRASSEGVTTFLYFRPGSREMAQGYGEEMGKVMVFLTGMFGLAPQANLALVETDDAAPNGYSAPGVLFLSPRAIGKQVNSRLLVNLVARQWWGNQTSPMTRNHLWIVNGMARYAEMMWVENAAGPGALEADIRDTYVEALTIDNPPVIQSARLEDYSPEYWAVTGAKGAAVLHMLRGIVGDEAFRKLIKDAADQYAGKSINTEEFRKAAEAAAGRDLRFFFIQWIESGGAPEFKLEYTVFRTKGGFRVMGKVSQDLDTFRMPVEMKIETDGNPEMKTVEVVGTSSEFIAETFGRPKSVVVDPNFKVLRYSNPMRVAVAIRRGEMYAEIGEFQEALKEYQKALDVNRNSSLAHYRVGEVFFLQRMWQQAANEFRQATQGDLEPKWVEVWSHINLGKIYDASGQRERAINEYNLAIRTKDNTQGAQEEAAKYLKTPYERPAPTN
jgi:tetratricopeptide (TPR) repeat protein